MGDWRFDVQPSLHAWPPRPRLASDGLPAVPSPAVLHAAQVGPPAQATRPARTRSGTWRLLLTGVGVLFLVACALTILLLIGSETGRSGFVLGAILATLPVPVLVAAFRWLDRYEPEPTRLLILAFVWGAAVATLAALFLNSLGATTLFTGSDEAVNARAAVYLAPPVEELAKGSLLLVLALRRRLDGVLDAIVFAGLVGVGFAFTENILYYGRAFAGESDTGTGVLVSFVVFIVRGVVSPFAHPLFTIPIGIGLGLAVRCRSWPPRILLPLAGYAVAMALHATWNGIAVRADEEQDLGLLMFGYVAIMVPIFFAALALAIWYRRREGRVLRLRLPAFAEAGWIAPHEVAVLSSLRLRGLARDVASRLGGREARRATDAYQRQVIELAFLRERLASGHRIEEGLGQQDRLLVGLPSLRRLAVVLPPPPGPMWRGHPPPGRPPGWTGMPPAPAPGGMPSWQRPYDQQAPYGAALRQPPGVGYPPGPPYRPGQGELHQRGDRMTPGREPHQHG